MKDKIIKLRKEGKTYNEIKKILGCSKSTISYHCSKLNILDDEEDLMITDLRKNGKTYHEIYTIFDKKITKEKIRMICAKNGLSYLDRLTDEDILKIKELYDEFKSCRKVAEITGCAVQTIRKYVDIVKTSHEERKKNKSNNVINWRKRKKLELVKYKGGKCEICGYDRCVRALEFHHTDINDKDFTISGKSWSYERLKKEVDKCILVCSNCHVEIHEELNR